MRTTLAVMACLSCLFSSSLAGATETSRGSSTCKASYQEQKIGSDQAVTFCDDPLLADDGAPLIAATGHPGRAFRANLIRPRTQFVTELLKTVENL